MSLINEIKSVYFVPLLLFSSNGSQDRKLILRETGGYFSPLLSSFMSGHLFIFLLCLKRRKLSWEQLSLPVVMIQPNIGSALQTPVLNVICCCKQHAAQITAPEGAGCRTEAETLLHQNKYTVKDGGRMPAPSRSSMPTFIICCQLSFMTMLGENPIVMGSHVDSLTASWRLVWSPVLSTGKNTCCFRLWEITLPAAPLLPRSKENQAMLVLRSIFSL